MSYHYQMSSGNEFFDSSNYIPQVMHTGYDFYSPNDSTSLMVPQLTTTTQHQSTVIVHQTQQSQQQLSDHIIPYGWRTDWTSTGPTTGNWIGTSSQGVINRAPISNAMSINESFLHLSNTDCYLDQSTAATSSLSSEKKTEIEIPPTIAKPIARIAPKPFRCQVCCKAFSQAANLTAHKRIHTGEKPFTCSVCHRPFSQSSSLVTHRRTHTGERPYPCGQCDKSFTDSSTLTKHLRTHTGQKPYGCPLCMMRFTQSGNLHRHMKTHKS